MKLLGDESEVDHLVASAHTLLRQAWEILQKQNPDDDAYSALRLIAKRPRTLDRN